MIIPFFLIFENSPDLDSPARAHFRGVFKFSVDQKLEHVEGGRPHMRPTVGVLLTVLVQSFWGIFKILVSGKSALTFEPT